MEYLKTELNSIYNSEINCSAELLSLTNIGVFPAAEIVQHKRDVQLLKDYSDNENFIDDFIQSWTNPKQQDIQGSIENMKSVLSQELAIAEKKLMMLKSRRMDEDRIISNQVSYDAMLTNNAIQESQSAPNRVRHR